eukprot:GGOE01047017.1.p2 GENE.GGOE01047017.1~~GGOE01047017.1.p2  ORF type:complete len:113 (-),score=4.58 GGOE01047017.1:9-347(-)
MASFISISCRHPHGDRLASWCRSRCLLFPKDLFGAPLGGATLFQVQVTAYCCLREEACSAAPGFAHFCASAVHSLSFIAVWVICGCWHSTSPPDHPIFDCASFVASRSEFDA